MTLTLFLLVLLKALQHPGLCAPQAVSFPHFQVQHVSVLCVSNTTSRQLPLCALELRFSLVREHSGAQVFSLVARTPEIPVSVWFQ